MELRWEGKKHGDLEQSWMWKRPVLCCTWSCGASERLCRVSSLDIVVPDTPPGVSFPFSLKGGDCCFSSCVWPTAPWVCSSVVFMTWFNYLSGNALLTHGMHTLDWRCEELQFYGTCYSWRITSFLRSASKLLAPFLPFHLNSSSINLLHSSPHSALLLFPPNL